MEERKTTSIVALVIIVIVVVFIVYSIFANPYGRVSALVLPTLLFAYGFILSYGDYLPFVPRGNQVNFDSGIAGTLRSALIAHAGGRMTGMVSFERSLVPEDVAKDRRVGGLFYLLDWITMGNITIYVTGEKWQWIDIPTNQTDNRHGSIRFVGNIRGEKLPQERETLLYMQLENLTTINRYALSTMEWIEHQTANIAAQKVIDMDSASQLFEKITDRAKNVRIVTKGGSGGEINAIASEMGSGQ